MNNFQSIIQRGPAESQYSKWFLSISEELLFKSHIIANRTRYRLKEIEFYYHANDHPDTTAYGYMKDNSGMKKDRIYRHKLKQTHTYTWFVHYSGIDIVFGKENTPGGILIRTIERLDGPNTELIKGPLVVMLELLNQSVNIFEGNNFDLKLVEANEKITGKIEKNNRFKIPVLPGQERKYNFSI